MSISISPANYAQLLYETLENKSPSEQDKVLANLKNILIKNKQAYLANFITKELGKIQAQKKQERTTYIASASELTAEQKKQLESISTEPREFSVNPELLGGVAVRSRDAIYNATLRKKLNLIKNAIA